MAAVVTFGELIIKILRNLDEVEDTLTTRALAGQFLNQAHLQRLTMQAWHFMRWDSVETITTIPGVRVYPLHEEYFLPEYFFNCTTRQYLEEIPERQLAESGARPREDATGPSRFRMAGYSHVRYQPVVASPIFIASSVAADTTTDKAITIRGETESGMIASETVTPTGVTGAPTLTVFRKILGVSKGAPWKGTMSVTSNGGAVTNLVLGPNEFGRRFPQIELLAAPPGSDIIEYRFWRQPSALVNLGDIPDIPPPFAEILVYDALMLFAGYLTDISDKSMVVWRNQQESWERQMRLHLDEGLSNTARPRTVRFIDADSGESVPFVLPN